MASDDRSGMSVMLTCRDMNKSAAFYRDHLGFDMKESWPDADNPMWANMVKDGQSIMIGSAMDPDKVGEFCQGDAEEEAKWRALSEKFQKNDSGVGVQIYVQVDDIDAYAGEIRTRGVELESEPTSQFYGIRESVVNDPDGYRLVFYTAIRMQECQSCGMPLKDAEPGEMYCHYCTDESGNLRPYEQVFEGTVTGYFMHMQKMERPQAEAAAKEHLSKMPAWASRGM